jgi:hypothetical protein
LLFRWPPPYQSVRRLKSPSVPRVTKDDAQKVVTIISGDQAKIQTYCDIQNLGEQMERANAGRVVTR